MVYVVMKKLPLSLPLIKYEETRIMNKINYLFLKYILRTLVRNINDISLFNVSQSTC